jgi:hypothetical protein
MSQFTQKYAIIQLFEDISVGTEFPSSNWPLHSTIADTFAMEWDVSTMVEKLTELLKNHERATSIAEDDRFFGDNGEVQVVLLQKTDSLLKLHYDVIELLEQGGWKPNDPQFAKEGFLPHSTVQPHGRLNKGDEVIFNALSLIDMFPNEDPYQRKVLETIKLEPHS